MYHKVSCADPENYSGGGGPMDIFASACFIQDVLLCNVRTVIDNIPPV